ncbi:MAG: transporter substrate-binding domain-containing protein [Pseudomonadota bacterium]
MGRHVSVTRGVAALLCVLACVPAAARDTITLCFERQEVLPWRTLTGGGLNFELLNQVATRLGITFEYQSMPWKRCLEQLKANEVGGAFAVSFAQSRLALGAYPGGSVPDPDKRMHVDRYVLMRKKGGRIGWDGKAISNVDGAVGFQLGYSVGEFLRGMKVPVDEGSQRASELAQKLIAGRLSGAALGGGDAANLMNGPLASQLEVLPAPLIEKPYYLVLSHALVASNPQLAERIWKGVEEARNSAAYRKLLRDAGGGHH